MTFLLLDTVQEFATFLRVLGCYPMDTALQRFIHSFSLVFQAHKTRMHDPYFLLIFQLLFKQVEVDYSLGLMPRNCIFRKRYMQKGSASISFHFFSWFRCKWCVIYSSVVFSVNESEVVQFTVAQVGRSLLWYLTIKSFQKRRSYHRLNTILVFHSFKHWLESCQ